MKKLAIIFFFSVLSFNTFGQFATFDPIINEPVRSAPANNLDQGERVTGYILDESGSVVSKVQLKVSIQDTEFGERVQVVGYYNVIPGFGASWEKTSARANIIGALSPITRQHQVAYTNFSYWVDLKGKKIWF